METKTNLKKQESFPLIFHFTAYLLLSFNLTFAHCDTRNGPVVKAAQQAINTGNINHVLIWVPSAEEGQIREAFNKTMDLRKINAQVQDFADNYFFETVVRIHRKGEGMAYTGLKDSGEVAPPIQVAEEALQLKATTGIMKLLNSTILDELDAKFTDVLSKLNFDSNNVDQGRDYVEKYVAYMHYVEEIYNAAEPEGAKHHKKEMIESKEHSSVDSPDRSFFHAGAMGNNNRAYAIIVVGTLLIITLQIYLFIKKQK